MREKLDAIDLGERSELLQRKAARVLVVAPIIGLVAGGVVGMFVYLLYYAIVIGAVIGALAGWSIGSERARRLRRAADHARREMLLERKL